MFIWRRYGETSSRLWNRSEIFIYVKHYRGKTLYLYSEMICGSFLCFFQFMSECLPHISSYHESSQRLYICKISTNTPAHFPTTNYSLHYSFYSESWICAFQLQTCTFLWAMIKKQACLCVGAAIIKHLHYKKKVCIWNIAGNVFRCRD